MMTPAALRMRILGTLLSSTLKLSEMTLAQIESDQKKQKRIPRNFLTNFILGGLQKGIDTEDRTIQGPGGDLPIRIYKPAGTNVSDRKPLIIYLHGGGWMLGGIPQGDWMCSVASRDVDAVVVSVDYRLAPQFKFPAGVEDCYAALLWCFEHAGSLGADAGRIGFMGESAGANLSAVACLMAKERGGPLIRHQALIYPPTDATMSGESFQTNKVAPILRTVDAEAVYRHYLEPGVDRMDWRLSPLHAPDHVGLPPATIIIGAHDPLRDDGVMYADKLKKSGVQVELKEYLAMPHAFINFPHLARDAKAAMSEVTRAQRIYLGDQRK